MIKEGDISTVNVNVSNQFLIINGATDYNLDFLIINHIKVIA